MVKVACVILTLNEEYRIEDCLKRLRPYVDFILVIDGLSTDKTVEIAEKYADKVITRHFSGSFSEEKNCARSSRLIVDYDYILWVDADELWDIGFLKDIKHQIESARPNTVYRLPRCNLPDGRDYPDYQVRLFPNSQDIEWHGKIHEVPYYVPENVPLDRMDKDSREEILPVTTLDEFPIIHLPRRQNKKRPWW